MPGILHILLQAQMYQTCKPNYYIPNKIGIIGMKVAKKWISLENGETQVVSDRSLWTLRLSVTW